MNIHMKLDALMQTEIPMTSGRSNLKGKQNYSTMAAFCFTLLDLVLCNTIYL